MSKSDRCQYVDIMKGWAMLMIIIFHAHNGMISSSVYSFFHPWDVPVFFIIAGFFLNEKAMEETPVRFMKKKLKTLYIPATIIYILAVLCHNVFVDLGWYRLGELHPGNQLPFDYYGVKEFFVGCMKALFCVGSGELVMGAMWFLYTLLYAFTGLCLLSYIIKIIRMPKELGGVVLVLGAIISCILTQKFDITITRINIAITAMLLITIGMLLHQYLKLKYDNVWVFTICLLLFMQCVILQHVTIVMARNSYQDLFQLCIGSCCVVYVLGYIAKKIERTLVGFFLSWMGRESLYLMAFHILGFFVCSSILWKTGAIAPESGHGMYTYCTRDNWGVLVLYVFCGIFVPFIIMFVFRQTRAKLISFVKGEYIKK